MSAETLRINEFFRGASKSDVCKVTSDILFTERQERIFSMFYLKRNDINFIADTLGTSSDTVNKELKKIRRKLIPFLASL